VLDVALDDQVAEVADEDRLKWLLAVPRCVVLFSSTSHRSWW
jgi:hypothetical protein